MLFEVALIEMPTKEEIEKGKVEKLVLPPTPVIAQDEKSAGVIAVMEQKEKIACDMQKVQVLVRPFI